MPDLQFLNAPISPIILTAHQCAYLNVDLINPSLPNNALPLAHVNVLICEC